MHLTVSVVIPTWNEQANLPRALESARRAGADQVIVADGGSCDGTVDLARRLGCQVVQSRAGRGRQQNAGAQLASGEVLLFLHADCWLTTDCLRQLRQACQLRDTAGGAFRQQINQPGWRYRLLERGNAARVRWCRLAYGDQGIFLRRRVWDQIGGFREIPLMEDVVLVRQLRTFGQLVLLPGPLGVSARRWQRHGLVTQTLRNWSLLTAFQLGVSPERLARFYRRHDD